MSKTTIIKIITVIVFLIIGTIIIDQFITKKKYRYEDAESLRITRGENNFKLDKIEIEEHISKNIMQTYKNIDNVPEFVIRNIKDKNPDWKYFFYGDQEAKDFLKKEYPSEVLAKFNSFSRGAHKADLFRLCWLYKNGGVYVDIDTNLLRPLDELVVDQKFTMPLTKDRLNRKRLLNCFIISNKGNTLVAQCIENVMKITDNDLKDNYRLILHVMQETLGDRIEYLFDEKNIKISDIWFLDGKDWGIYNKKDELIGESKYKNYDQINGFI
jgi:hypothetical protein